MRRLLITALFAACATTGPLEGTEATTHSSVTSKVSPMSQPWKDAATVESLCAAALESATKLRQELEEGRAAQPLETYRELLKVLDAPNGWVSLLFQVSPEASVREASDACKQRLSKFGNDVTLDRRIFDALAAVDVSGLGAETQRSHRLILREFKRSGVDKDDATRDRLRTVYERLVELGQDYQKNVSEDVRSIALTDVKELDGLPADWIAGHPLVDGKITVTTDYPDYVPLLTYAKNADVRKRLAREFAARGYPKNAPLLQETLELRSEYAKILGYPSWAAYFAEDKMVKTTATIESFLTELLGIVRPRADADTRELLSRKKKDLPEATEFALWDRFYYLGVVREETYGYDAQAVRNYFPYTAVKNGIMELYAELFGLEFVRASDVPTWHPDVEAWRIQRDGRAFGIFFLDMHPRADKYKHAAMFPIQTGLAGGAEPMASLVCNFPNPSGGDALMEHGDVETFFHEFGHLLHHLLANKATWTNLGGISVEWDFVEAPSQILEEWAWSWKVLARFAKDPKTGEVIPQDLVERMRRADEFGKGAETLRQLFFAAYSYYVHARDPGGLDLEAFSDEMFKTYSPYARVDTDHLYANFAHLIGYTSAYYTYQWSLVIAKDLYTRFEAAGIMDPKVAREYAEKILAPGGMADAADLVEDFLGRPYSLDAYRKWLSQ